MLQAAFGARKTPALFFLLITVEQLLSGPAVSDPNYSVASAEKIQRPGQNKQRSPAFQHCWLESTVGDPARGKRQERRKGGRDLNV